jgi:hypothetical protein
VRIDRSDLADVPGSGHWDRRARSAPDDPATAGKDQGKAVGGGGPPDPSRACLRSALHMDRTAAYRAAVDAYRQYAIDNGYAQVEKLEDETFTPAMRQAGTEDLESHLVSLEDRQNGKDRPTEAAELENLQVPDRTMLVLVHDVDGRGYGILGAAADYMLTGARGPASGREFRPETAGGPIQQLDAGKERITNEGVQEATAHLQRFTGGGPLEALEQAMLDRLTSIAAGDMEPTSYDLNFYAHELDEAGRYARLGFGPDSGVDIGSPEMYHVWNDVHTAALEDFRISGADLFYPGLAP